jgi:putative DNA primase/helicase
MEQRAAAQPMNAAELVKRLGGHMHGSYGLVRCPTHQDRGPSLSVSDGADGRILVKCHAGCNWRQVIDDLRRQGAWPEAANDPPVLGEAERERRRRQEAERRCERARRDAFVAQTWQQTWEQALPGPGSPIEHWLRVRGIDPGALDLDRLPLRWASRCPLGRSTAPAMVALMTDPVRGAACGIHRTFLLPDGSGKAPVEQPRMMLGTAGIVRLSPDEDVTLGLGICEGIETGLSLMAAGWRPIWAAGSLEAVHRFPVLSGIECLTIFADPKPHEVAGARSCADRWAAAGRKAIVRIPQGGDWNDALGQAA